MKALMEVVEALVKSRGMTTAKVAYKTNTKGEHMVAIGGGVRAYSCRGYVVSNRTLAELLQLIGAAQTSEVDAWRYITVSSDEKATTAPRDPSHLAEVRGSDRPVRVSGREFLTLIGNGASDKLTRKA